MNQGTNEENVYKASESPAGIRNEIKQDLEKNLAKFSDPVVIGEMLYKLLEERENTNRILKNILGKLDALEGKYGQSKEIQEIREETGDVLLPDIDESILTFVKELGKATAEDVRKKFNYKGKNAASARLNRLFELQLLEKKQVGKKVFFIPK